MFGRSRKDQQFYSAFQALAHVVLEASEVFSTMLGDPASGERIASVIKEKRGRADAVVKKTVRQLHATWITPLDRHQIHELVVSLDGVITLVNSTASRLVLFAMKDVRGDARQLAGHVTDSCKRLCEAMELLPDLSKEHAERVMTLATEVHELEGKADEAHRRSLAAIFDGSVDPLTVMKWREIFDNLEEATNLCRNVSQVFEAIVLENA